MPIWGPDVPHLLLIASATDEELVVPPRFTATSERTFRHADVLGGIAVELPHGDEPFGEKKEQGCEDSLILSGEFSLLEDVIIVIPGSDKKGYYVAFLRELEAHSRVVGLTPPGNSIRLATEEGTCVEWNVVG